MNIFYASVVPPNVIVQEAPSALKDLEAFSNDNRNKIQEEENVQIMSFLYSSEMS